MKVIDSTHDWNIMLIKMLLIKQKKPKLKIMA